MKASLLLLALTRLAIALTTVTPEGCKKNSTDVDWPTPAEWTAAMAEVEVHKQTAGAKHPDYLLRAESYKDVQRAVAFCSKNNIRLSVIVSGHDFLGRNDAPSGLTVDVSLLKGTKVLESYTPTVEGVAKPGKTLNTIVPVPGKQAAVTFGAGISTQQLQNAAFPSKLFTIGAAHGSVSVAGGWGLTGGHGPLTHKYGLGVDQFLEFKVVTADGDLKIANAVSNPDLFWALRGGGGSTFGIVVEATVKAYPNERVSAADFTVSSTGTAYNDGMFDAYSYFLSQMPEIVKKGVSGYFYFQPNLIRTLMIHPGNISGTANVEAFWKPYLTKMSSFASMKPANLSVFNYGSYKPYFDAHFGAVDNVADDGCVPNMRKRHGPGSDMAAPAPSGPMPLDSRLLGEAHLTSPNLKAALKAASYNLQGHLVANPGLTYENTSVLPAWRKAYVHLIGTKVTFGNTVMSSVDSLRKLAPDMGAYMNEAYFGEEDWKTTFWGSNYPKLSEIKTRYDPNMLFWASPAINADMMEVRDGRLCKASPGLVATAFPPKTDNRNDMRAGGGAINSLGYGTAPKGKSGCGP